MDGVISKEHVFSRGSFCICLKGHCLKHYHFALEVYVYG